MFGGLFNTLPKFLVFEIIIYTCIYSLIVKTKSHKHSQYCYELFIKIIKEFIV